MSGKRRAGLAKDAVPSIFGGAPRYLSKKIKSPRKQVKRHAHRVAPSKSTSHGGSSTEPMPTSPGEISSASGVSAEMKCDSSTVAAREPYANAARDLSFGELFNSTPGISLPPQSSWAVHRTDAEGVRDIVFIDAAVTHRTSDGSSLVFNRKALHVKSDMTVQAYVFGKQVGTAALGLNPSVSTVSELDTMLSVMNSTIVCCGGPNLKDFPGVAPECAFVDCQGNWRHNRCLLVPPSGTIRHFCSGLADTLRIHAGRRAARAKQDRPLKRIRLEVAPAKKQKLHALRRANYALQRSRARLVRRNKLLLEQLQASRKELTQLQEEDVTQKWKGLNLPPAQLLLLEECISAAKCTSKTSRWYTDDWLLLCLLLNIHSPAAYAFLRTNDMLPLPCITTITKYISMVGLKCGFDENFFKAFKMKISSKPQFQRRGMLIFDEIQVRKEISVNSKTMTYTGLVDHEETKDQSSELADHGLVFAFTPFGENYLQPVAVFASKGPTKGTLLAQLLIQCIVKLE
ncbi:hypothetical protein HPB51_017419 [Rhipicephalus microplus]|uniref:Transposable element P transposase-like RNase H domain-containing protein n=1 Tax=Rhipicephalus microplus TaxID=6941 RepID=A0A9J6D5W5_RHIMP|nr:hypothetical protein HPB51_017419 [Rhipicephalus microplus]